MDEPKIKPEAAAERGLLRKTREIFEYLHNNRDVRLQIRAAPDKTLVYSGSFPRNGAWIRNGSQRTLHGKEMGGVWQHVLFQKEINPHWRDKEILPEVLDDIPVSTRGGTLLDWANELDELKPWKDNGFLMWRALSGIFCANAKGTVSFCIGSEVSKDDKVFAANEISVLLRNPEVDVTSKELLRYYQRCLQTKQPALINIGFIAG